MILPIRFSLLTRALVRLKIRKQPPYATAYEWHPRFRWLPLVLYDEETGDYCVAWLATVMRKRMPPKPGRPREQWWYYIKGHGQFRAQRICYAAPEN